MKVTNVDCKQIYANIACHVEMMVTPEIRKHAYASEEHDLDFQIFRILSGYSKAIEERDKLFAALKGMESIWKSVCSTNGWDENHLIEYRNARAAIAEVEADR